MNMQGPKPGGPPQGPAPPTAAASANPEERPVETLPKRTNTVGNGQRTTTFSARPRRADAQGQARRKARSQSLQGGGGFGSWRRQFDPSGPTSEHTQVFDIDDDDLDGALPTEIPGQASPELARME